MFKFFIGRASVMILTFIGVSILSPFRSFACCRATQSPLLSGERVMSPERHAAISHELGFDRPIVIQYLDYLWGVLRGDFGTSIVTKQPVLDQFFQLFPATLELSLCAITFAILLGIPAGVFAAIKRGSVFDQAIMGTALIGFSMPIFWWGLLLIMLMSNTLHWTPVSGRISLMFFFPPVTGFMLIDSLIVRTGGRLPFGGQPPDPADNRPRYDSACGHRAARPARAMLEVLSEDYVRTARAKGLSPLRVIGVHALRNAMIPVVTTIGLQVGVMLAGAILTETIFSWPGIGKWLVDSVSRRDYAVIQGALLIIAATIMLVNLACRSALWLD